MSPFDEDPSENRSELELCIDEIHQLQTQLTTEIKKTQWKLVSEELPEKTKEDLRPEIFVFDGESMTVALWRHYKFGWDFETDKGKPTHWLLIDKPEGK